MARSLERRIWKWPLQSVLGLYHPLAFLLRNRSASHQVGFFFWAVVKANIINMNALEDWMSKGQCSVALTPRLLKYVLSI